MHEYAITVIGTDRPGIIADVSAALANLGLNLTDSTMTLLRGHFAMTLICAGGVEAGEVEAALAGLSGGLVVSVREVAPGDGVAPAGGRSSAPGASQRSGRSEEGTLGAGTGKFVLRLHGADRLGIVAAVTTALAQAGGNITDLTTRLASGLYVIVAEVDLPSTVDIDVLAERLHAVAADLGVEATLAPVESDLL